jgi:hypothetical protein
MYGIGAAYEEEPYIIMPVPPPIGTIGIMAGMPMPMPPRGCICICIMGMAIGIWPIGVAIGDAIPFAIIEDGIMPTPIPIPMPIPIGIIIIIRGWPAGIIPMPIPIFIGMGIDIGIGMLPAPGKRAPANGGRLLE